VSPWLAYGALQCVLVRALQFWRQRRWWNREDGGRVCSSCIARPGAFGRHSKRGPLAFVPNFMAFRRGLRDVRMVRSALVV